MAHVFISYVRDDAEEVAALAAELRREGLDVWLDRDSIAPGSLWRDALREAIERGAFFVACFSDAYFRRDETYMEEELRVAADVYSGGAGGPRWLVPVRLTDCSIPDLSLGGGRTLRDLQWVDVFEDWGRGVRELLRVVRPQSVQREAIDLALRELCERHVRAKIARDQMNGAFRVRQIEDLWHDLLAPSVWEPTLSIAVPLFERIHRAARPLPLTERWHEPAPPGRVVFVTVSPTPDADAILQSLAHASASGPDAYRAFLTKQREKLRGRHDWQSRDLVHWIFAVDGEELTVDLLYWVNLALSLLAIGAMIERRQQGIAVGPVQSMYPGSLITGPAMESIVAEVTRHEVALRHAESSTSR